MRTNHFQNPYSNFGDDDRFPDNQIAYNHHHDDEPVMAFEGSSSNRGFDQISNHALNLHPQGGSPIGLSLKKSESLINLVEMALRGEKKVESPQTPEKLKASNFHALLLQVGSWKRISRNEGDLVAKIYYAKKKLVWEFLDGPLKSKLEIQWSEISAIRSFVCDGEHGRLEIELSHPPLFCRETNPQPRKHTQWKQTTDFTGGQASICRRHSVIFPPGVLDKQYEKLLQCDNRLFTLSQQPFPVNNYPFFYHDPSHYLDSSYMNVHNRPPTHFHGGLDSNVLMSDMTFLCSNEGARRHTFNNNQERENNHYEGIHATNPIEVEYEQSQRVLREENNLTGYVNGGTSSVDELLVGSRNGIQECNSWVGVQHLYELPWDSRMENFGDLYRNHQC